MEFLNPEFDRAQQMIDEVHKQHAHMSISIWASFGPETKAFKEMKEKNLLLDFQTWPQSGLSQWPPRMDYPSGVRCYDVYSKEARDIYWKNLSRLHKMGIDAWWMDSTDPDQMNVTDEQRDQPTANVPSTTASASSSSPALTLLVSSAMVPTHGAATSALHGIASASKCLSVLTTPSPLTLT